MPGIEGKEKKYALLAAIEENAAHAFISTTTTGTITSFNKAAENMLGYTAEELVGKETPAKFHDLQQVVERSVEYSKSLQKKIEPGFDTFICHSDLGMNNQFEWTYIHKDGTKFPVLLSITALYDAGGEKFGYLGIAQDISALRQQEKELVESNKALQSANGDLRQFAYRTSHDLKSPLITSERLLQYIKQDLDNRRIADVKANLAKIEALNTKLIRLIDDILAMVKADFEVNGRQLVNLHHCVEQSFEAMSQAEEGGAQVNLTVKGDPGLEGTLDQARLQHVLVNLLSNAAKYRNPLEAVPVVSVSLSQAKQDLCLVVEDNGIGIPSHAREKLFQPFQRFHPKVGYGSGLGMSIVKKHVEAMSGTIEYMGSGALGGACFKIILQDVFPKS